MDDRHILLVVEGEDDEPKLFKRIFSCFKEIGLSEDNICVYGTSLWVLNDNLRRDFGDDWYNEEIDFLEYIKSKKPELCDKKITDIFLVFDYERQDHRFNPEKLMNMQRFFSNSTENGQLYLNYPMIEAYRHMKKPLPDIEFLDRACPCDLLFQGKYKERVGAESKFTQLSKISREDFRELVMHNLCKASRVAYSTESLSYETALEYWDQLDLDAVLDKQNTFALSNDKFVYVLSTCLFFIPEYNSKLIFLE